LPIFYLVYNDIIFRMHQLRHLGIGNKLLRPSKPDGTSSSNHIMFFSRDSRYCRKAVKITKIADRSDGSAKGGQEAA